MVCVRVCVVLPTSEWLVYTQCTCMWVWLGKDMVMLDSLCACPSITLITLNRHHTQCMYRFAVVCCCLLLFVSLYCLLLHGSITCRLGKTTLASMITLPPLCSRVQWMQETRTFPSQSFQWYVLYITPLHLLCLVMYSLCV